MHYAAMHYAWLIVPTSSLEECEQDVACGEVAEDEGEEGGDASVQDGGADRLHCAHCSLAF